MLEAADEEGMIIQCGDHDTVLEPYRRYYEGVWTPIMRWTRRHPSMCIYGFGGERDYYEGIIEQYQRQYDLIKRMNPEALVMPQTGHSRHRLLFDAQGRKGTDRKPFPHHAERLARYTKACDLFGHYSGGALSYTYDKPPTWQEWMNDSGFTASRCRRMSCSWAPVIDPENARPLHRPRAALHL